MIQKPLQFVQRGRILLRCGSAFGVIAALLGRFLPRLGPLANASGPFFFSLFFGPSFFPVLSLFLRSLSCRFHAKAAAWNIQEPEYSRTGIFKSWNIQALQFSRSGISRFRVPSSATARELFLDLFGGGL